MPTNEATTPVHNPLTLQAVAAINELYRRTDELYHEVARSMGLPDCAFEIMYSLWEHDGLTQAQLCKTSFSTKQTVSSSIKRLCEEGLVEVRVGGATDAEGHANAGDHANAGGHANAGIRTSGDEGAGVGVGDHANVRTNDRARIVHLTKAGRSFARERIVPVLDAECAAVDIFTPSQQRHLIEQSRRYTDSLASQFESLR